MDSSFEHLLEALSAAHYRCVSELRLLKEENLALKELKELGRDAIPDATAPKKEKDFGAFKSVLTPQCASKEEVMIQPPRPPEYDGLNGISLEENLPRAVVLTESGRDPTQEPIVRKKKKTFSGAFKSVLTTHLTVKELPLSSQEYDGSNGICFQDSGPIENNDTDFPTSKQCNTRNAIALNNPSAKVNQDQMLSYRQRCAAILEGEGFELMICLTIILNTVALAVEMQYHGAIIGEEIDFKVGHIGTTSATYDSIDDVFLVLEFIFVIFFTVEFGIRTVAVGLRLIWKPMSWLDCVVVVSGVLGLLFSGDSADAINASYLRLLRLVKLARALRLIRFTKFLGSLHLLLKSISSSGAQMFWSMALLLVFQCVAGMILGQYVHDYIVSSPDGADNLRQRHDVYRYYGTFTRATFTMFEVTFANWAPACRVLTNNISEGYAIFFFVYRCLIGFCVLNVINAVFVQSTMRVASADQEVMILAKEKAQEDYTRKLKILFASLDVSGDGYVSYDEFSATLSQPEFVTWLSSLELDSSDLEQLFDLIDDGDGQISIDEFLQGAKRLRGSAKSIDMAQLMLQVSKLGNQLTKLESSIGRAPPRASDRPFPADKLVWI